MGKTLGEQIHGISEGRLSEKVIVRTSVRSSMRNTITKAIKNTLRLGSAEPSDPKRKERDRSSSSSSAIPRSASSSGTNLHLQLNQNCEGKTHSSLINIPRHSSLRYPGNGLRQAQALSGASPVQQRFPMSVSFYEPGNYFEKSKKEEKSQVSSKLEKVFCDGEWISGSAPIIHGDHSTQIAHNYRSVFKESPNRGTRFALSSSHGGLDQKEIDDSSHHHNPHNIGYNHRDSGLFTSQSCKTLQSSPSLTTLRDFDMSNEYDDPCEFDCKSVISTASTSRISDRKRNSHHIRSFLKSPESTETISNAFFTMRLRKDRGIKKDALEAGFEVPTRRLSRLAVKDGGGSEFDPRVFLNSTLASIEYSTPMDPHVTHFNDRNYSLHQYSSHNEYAGSPQRPNQMNFPSSPPKHSQLLNVTPPNNGRITPTHLSQRRSVPVVRPQPVNHFTNPTSQINKVVVPPQTRRSGQERRGENGINAMVVERRSSNPSSGHNSAVIVPTYRTHPNDSTPTNRQHKDSFFTREVLVDAPPSNEAMRLEKIEQRLRSLELDQTAQAVVPVAVTSPTLGFHSFEQIVNDRDNEISSLQNKLRKTLAQQEIEQRVHASDLSKCRRENHELKDELHRVNERLSALESDYNVCEQYQERIGMLEKQLEKAAEDQFFAEFKAQNLAKDVEEKDARIKELEAELGAIRAEHLSYGQSCSSGSTPVVDELETATMDGSMIGNDGTPIIAHDSTRKMYKKAHSTLGASMSPSVSNGQLSSSQSYLTALGSQSHLRKSISNFQIDHRNLKGDVTPAITQLIQKQGKYLLDARVLTKALAELASQVENGSSADLTSITQIQALAFDSMSESEAEMLASNTPAMSMDEAQRKLEKQQSKLNGITKDLDDLTRTLTSLYSDRISSLRQREMTDDDGCRIQ
ncbi:unnamed protein product, partial [Mesorhabditis belari]|uniref:Uncharacterized protein n=1 Tax=Mesorhabditis belari TaxID=2138241 RepID=A0AAF3F2C8_9BILA